MSGLFSAAPMAAGPDAIRGSGPYQLDGLCHPAPKTGCPNPRPRAELPISSVHPSRSSIAAFAYAAAAVGEVLYGSRFVITAQAIRASLLASAKETNRNGRRPSSSRTQTESRSSLPDTRRMTAVAPTVSSRRSTGRPALICGRVSACRHWSVAVGPNRSRPRTPGRI